MTTELTLQSVPPAIFRDGKNRTNEHTTVGNTGSFDTADTCETSLESTKVTEKVEETQKQGILKRIRSRSRKGARSEEKKSVGRRMMGRLSFGKRSKAKKVEVVPKKMSSTNTVASEETPTRDENSESKVEIQCPITETVEVPLSEPSCPVEPAIAADVTEEVIVEEPVVVVHDDLCHSVEDEKSPEVVEDVVTEAQTEEIVEMVEGETEAEECVDEIPPEKASFHQDSADYLGLAMVGLLIGLLASPLFHG